MSDDIGKLLYLGGESFLFGTDISALAEIAKQKTDRTYSLIVVLDEKEWSSKQDLLTALSKKMGFPEYFGNTWDALFDCLCDFSWRPSIPKYILLFHRGASQYISQPDFGSYLNILSDTHKFWLSDNVVFKAVFPMSLSDRIKVSKGNK